MNLIRELVRHHIWATQTLMAYCAALPTSTLQELVPATQRTILNTLGHIVGTEQLYMEELTGESAEAPIRAGEVPELADLRLRFEAQVRRWDALLDRIDQLDAHLPKHDSRSDTPHPPGLLLLQTIHHGTDHRAQICTALSLLGLKTPELDGWAYWDAMHPSKHE